MAQRQEPAPRTGPRPLPVHLAAASSYYATCFSASMQLSAGSMGWSPALAERAAQLARDLTQNAVEKGPESAGPESAHPAGNSPDSAFLAALDHELRSRIGRMLAGIEKYRHHPYRRAVPPPTLLWIEGTTKVWDYRPFMAGRGAKVPVLLIPSLVNRAYILDLDETKSLARRLSRDGHPVFLVDWDAPGEVERPFDLGDYIARLRRAIGAVSGETGTPVAAVGYCMGGLLALSAAMDCADRVDALILMATPWDFHADRADHARAFGAILPALEPILSRCGELPLDVLQSFFAALDPMLALKKFGAFSARDMDSPGAVAFVALEDWLNDGVALSAPVARECIGGWYGQNTPMRKTWRIDGLPVDPARWTKPALALIPADDRIVPPASAQGLVSQLPDCRVLTPPVGHIGMVTARGAPRAVWDPMRDFLAALA